MHLYTVMNYYHLISTHTFWVSMIFTLKALKRFDLYSNRGFVCVLSVVGGEWILQWYYVYYCLDCCNVGQRCTFFNKVTKVWDLFILFLCWPDYVAEVLKYWTPERMREANENSEFGDIHEFNTIRMLKRAVGVPPPNKNDYNDVQWNKVGK